MRIRSVSALHVFSIISGIFFMGMNALIIIMPMRLSDQGLSYTHIGSVMAMLAIGMLIVKPVIGMHSDTIGQKAYLLFALVLGGLTLFFMAFCENMLLYTVLSCCFGVSKGIFSAVTSAYTIELSDQDKLGSSFGSFIGISTLFTCGGGAFAGIGYRFQNGSAVLLLFSAVFFVALLAGQKYLPDTGKKQRKAIFKNPFCGMNSRIYVFAALLFIQQFTTGPLWSTFVPLQFYVKFGVSASLLGIFMSLDELVGSPASFLAGTIVDKVKGNTFLPMSFFFASITGIGLLFAETPTSFLLLFLLCGIFITGAQVAFPQGISVYMRSEAKGFEFALLSTCAGLGEGMGNLVLGRIVQEYSIQPGILLFVGSYGVVALISFFSLRNSKVKRMMHYL